LTIWPQLAHFFPAPQCLGRIVGADPHGRAHVLLRRLQVFSGHLQVIGEQPRLLLPSLLRCLDGLRDHAMEEAPPFQQDGVVGNLLHQRMPECVQPLVIGRQVVHQLGPPQLRQCFGEIGGGKPGNGSQGGKRELAADHRGAFEDLLGFVAEAVDPRGDHCLNRRRQGYRVDPAFQLVGASFAFEVATLD
jgi:hypothetical protein